MIFERKLLEQIITNDSYDHEVIRKDIMRLDQWTVRYSIIFLDLNRKEYFYFEYDDGAFENLLEHSGELIDCPKVMKVKKELEVWALPYGKFKL